MIKTKTSIFVAIALLLIGFAAGWWVNGHRLGTQLSDTRAAHAQHLAAQQAASAEVISRTLLRERDLHNQLEEHEQNAQEEKQALARDLADSNAVALRMRQQLDYLSGRISADTGTAAECAPARAAAGVLAELLGEADELAGIFAEYADRAGIAGRACERAYDSLSE